MLQIIKELLEAGSFKSEDDALKVDAEVSKIIKKANDGEASWRVKYRELQSTFDEVKGSKEALEKQLETLDERIEKAKQDGKAEVVTELEAQRNEKAELAGKLKNLETTTKALKIENALSKELAKYEVIDNEFIADGLKLKLDLKDDKVQFTDGKDLEAGLKEFFDAKPNLLKPKGNGGSGADSANAGSGYAKGTETEAFFAQMNNR